MGKDTCSLKLHAVKVEISQFVLTEEQSFQIYQCSLARGYVWETSISK